MSAQQQRFARDGYTIHRQVLDAGLVQEARDHVVWLLERNPGVRPEQLHHHLMRNDPFWVRLVSDDRLLDIAEEYVGPNIALFASHYISKPRRTDNRCSGTRTGPTGHWSRWRW